MVFLGYAPDTLQRLSYHKGKGFVLMSECMNDYEFVTAESKTGLFTQKGTKHLFFFHVQCLCMLSYVMWHQKTCCFPLQSYWVWHHTWCKTKPGAILSGNLSAVLQCQMADEYHNIRGQKNIEDSFINFPLTKSMEMRLILVEDELLLVFSTFNTINI